MGTKEILQKELKQSVKNLKDQGLDIAEDVAVKVVVEMSDMLGRIALQTENKIDDFYLIVKGKFEGMLLEYADKINGKKDQKK